MTDISIAAPALEAEQAPASVEDAAFYVVSPRKLTILFIVTMGLYSVYWFYKNWSQYRDHGTGEGRQSIWPAPRGLFAIFFVHSLFSKIKELGRDKPQVAAWRNNLYAWWIVAIYIALNVADRLARKSIGLPFTDIFGYVGLILLLFGILKAQSMINASCNDPQGKGNAALTGANYVWIILGVLVSVGAFVSGFMDGAPDGVASSSSF
jgi:hypothetical protein